MTTQTRVRAIGGVTLGVLILFLLSGILYWQAVGADMSNPHANFWRAVREGVPGFTTVSDAAHRTLIRNGGENWRELRNGLIVRFSPWVFAAVLVIMGLLVSLLPAREKLEKRPSGVMIKRYSLGREDSALVYRGGVHHHGHHRPEPPVGAGGADTDLRSSVRCRIPRGDEAAAQLFGTAAPRRDFFGIRRLGSRRDPPQVRPGLVQEYGRHARRRAAPYRDDQRRREGMVLAGISVRDRRRRHRHAARFPDLGADPLHHAALPRDPRHRGGPVRRAPRWAISIWEPWASRALSGPCGPVTSTRSGPSRTMISGTKRRCARRGKTGRRLSPET